MPRKRTVVKLQLQEWDELSLGVQERAKREYGDEYESRVAEWKPIILGACKMYGCDLIDSVGCICNAMDDEELRITPEFMLLATSAARELIEERS